MEWIGGVLAVPALLCVLGCVAMGVAAAVGRRRGRDHEHGSGGRLEGSTRPDRRDA